MEEQILRRLVHRPRRLVVRGGVLEVPAGEWAGLEGGRYGPPPAGPVSFTRSSGLPPEGFRIAVGAGGISIEAGGDPGAFRAVQTLRLLADREKECGMVWVPFVELEDWPDLPRRGLMIDVSRDKVPRLSTLFWLIDVCALLGINELQLYTEHTFAYLGHERVWKDAGAYTPEDVSRIVSYAAERGITVIPNQNSLGHMERWFAHPEYRILAEKPEGFMDPWGVWREIPTTLCPVDERVFPFLEGLFSQLLPLFPAGLCNVGGDEPFEFGTGRSADEVKRKGAVKVYLAYMMRLKGMVERFGKRMQMWGDFVLSHPEILGELPRDVEVADWGYEADCPFERNAALLAEAGIPFSTCVGTSCWLSLGGRWPNARENIRRGVQAAAAHGGEGVLLTEWGDQGHFQQWVAMLLPLVAYALASWHISILDGVEEWEDETTRVLSSHIYRDGSGALAEAHLLLSSLPAIEKARFHNSSPFAVLLIDHVYPYYRKEYPRLAAMSFDEDGEQIERASSLIAGVGGGGILREELAFTARMLEFAVEFARHFLATPDFSVVEIPREVRRSLAEHLDTLLFEYEVRWKLRNREGGFADSVGRLRALKVLLER
ncbi:beta-N-acetylhexosaminidase [Spirochaeta thermophila]|uniref:beta-N-acetylhexosaminidase n=1 Tax=Winmispira thermophila (strain ATCC 49972 / DSM 6192 / RI 19.B1) TaxID=665571 RepID=E0RNW4_WINT6|nr:family 20 glycosylhydrolase [Spirochaeta thermophila]ADN01237.1 glycoside hydrolase, family 20 [Spirochaeta thermophila DSM 6192]